MADKDGVIYPPYWNTGAMPSPVREKGSRTQSTTPHKKWQRPHRQYNPPLVRNDSRDGIIPLLSTKDGDDDMDNVGSSVKAAPQVTTSALSVKAFRCAEHQNKNTTPERGVVSATYPNDTSAARCIGRRQRHTIHMSSHRQVCTLPYWPRHLI